MTLTTINDNQPDWVKPELGLEEYKNFKLGQKVKYNNDWVYIIHIQKVEESALFRGMLSNGASITMLYDLINKPVETTNEEAGLNIIIPNAFFNYYGVNPETMDGFHCECLVNNKKKFVSFNEEEIDDKGNKRYSFPGL